jgi:hypothetical protein
MPTRRRRLKRNFTVVSNQLLYDDRLGSDEYALMVYLLSRPDNWKLIPRDIAGRMKWGRDKAYNVLKCLMGFGYITRTQERDVWAQSWGEVVYTVYSNADDNPDLAVKTREPLPESPLPEKTDHLIRTDRDQINTERKSFKAAVSAPAADTTVKLLRRNANRDRLADRLSPHDRNMGYEMLAEGAVLDDLLRKILTDTLTEADLHPVRNAYIERGCPEVIVRTWRELRKSVKELSEAAVRDAFNSFAEVWEDLFPAEQARIVQLLVERVDVKPDSLSISYAAKD